MTNLINRKLSNRYRIEEGLGRGGMADVYKAWDQQRAAYLAIKVLRQDLSRDMIFLIVFMAMEYIDGATLQDEIFRSYDHPFNDENVYVVMKSLCSALHYAHQQGLVHCDIKPGNIMINQEGKVLLTGFGIARMTDASTATMVGFGTPAYMAPELVQGQDPTPQSDIYSLGVILYEMVTGGKRPFTGDEAAVTGTTSEKVRWEQVHLYPPSPCQYNPSLSPDLETIILKCLEKDPQERFTSPLEIIYAVESSSLIEQPSSFESNQKRDSMIQDAVQRRAGERKAGEVNSDKGTLEDTEHSCGAQFS